MSRSIRSQFQRARVASVCACMMILTAMLNGGTQAAEQLPGNDATLVVSAGLLMLITSGPDATVAASKLDDPQNYVVVPAGQFMMLFKDKKRFRLPPRYLAVTEKGVWGYIQANDPDEVWYVGEDQLRAVYNRMLTQSQYDNSGKSVLIVAPYSKTLHSKSVSISVTFTRGELYEVEKIGQDFYRIKLSAEKKADIQKVAEKAGASEYRPPEDFDIPASYTAQLNFDTVIPDETTFLKASGHMSDMRSIFAAWTRLKPLSALVKDCYVQIVDTKTFDLSGEVGGSVNLSAGGSLGSWLTAKGTVDAAVRDKAEKKYEETQQLDAKIERHVWMYEMEQQGQQTEIDITSDRTCGKGDRVYGIETDEWHEFPLEVLKTANPNLAKLVDPDTGRTRINCYEDYVTVRQYVQSKIRDGVDIFLTRFVRINNRDNFFNCSSKPER